MRRSHIEIRARDTRAPRQNVADDHTNKRGPKKKRNWEVNAMTAKLAALRDQLIRNGGDQP